MEDLPVDVGLIYEGERIRKSNMYVDLAGPKSKGAELLLVAPPEEVEDGKVEVIGPDVPDMEEGSRHPLGIFIKVSGKALEEDLEGVFERRIHDFCNYVQGFMHLNSRDIIWCRVSKDSAKKGLKLEHVGKAIIGLYKSEFEAIEKYRLLSTLMKKQWMNTYQEQEKSTTGETGEPHPSKMKMWIPSIAVCYVRALLPPMYV